LGEAEGQGEGGEGKEGKKARLTPGTVDVREVLQRLVKALRSPKLDKFEKGAALMVQFIDSQLTDGNAADLIEVRECLVVTRDTSCRSTE
jgi:hypothetical protein